MNNRDDDRLTEDLTSLASGGSFMKKAVAFVGIVIVLIIVALSIAALRDNALFRTVSNESKGTDIADRGLTLFAPRVSHSNAIQAFKSNLRRGDYVRANEGYQKLLNTRLINPNDRALAVWIAGDLPQKANGDEAGALQSIRELKATIIDERVDSFLRAMSINALANVYYGSGGRDPRIFEATFSGEPFEQLRVEGDAFASMQNLYLWSYELSPASVTAILIARWHVIEVLENKKTLTQGEINTHVQEAEKFVGEATQLVRREQAARSVGRNSRRLASYMYWNTYVRAALAEIKGEPYLSTYQDEYQSLFKFLARSPNSEVAQYIPYAHWLYAHFLVVLESDSAEAKKHLKIAVDFVNTDSQRDINEFLVFIRNTPAESTDLIKENNIFNTMLVEAAEQDDAFKAFIDSINPALLK